MCGESLGAGPHLCPKLMGSADAAANSAMRAVPMSDIIDNSVDSALGRNRDAQFGYPNWRTDRR